MSPTYVYWVAGILNVSMFCSSASAAEPSLMERFTSVSDHAAQNPSANDWLMWRRTYNSWGYSPLDQINKRNIGHLQLAWATGFS